MSIAHQFDFVLLSYSINVFQLIKCGQQKEEDEEKGELNKVTKEVKHVVNRHPHTHTHIQKWFQWGRTITYRLPIIHVDSNFEGHCETANGPLRFSMQLLTVLYSYKHVHTVVQCTCTNANMWTCFCLLYLCNRCRCDHIEDGTTESETFCSGSIQISKMLNSNVRKENVISRAAEISFWSQ